MSEENIVILLEEESMFDVGVKWSLWLAVLVVFVVALIYFSNYFGTSKGCNLRGKMPKHKNRPRREYV